MKEVIFQHINEMWDELRTCGEFQKVSFEQFYKDVGMVDMPNKELLVLDAICLRRNTKGREQDCRDVARDMYDNIKLPVRSTYDSSGHDFFAPFEFMLEPGQSIMIPTGIRVLINHGWDLSIFPRSGLGVKYRCQLDNTCGIIDADYSGSSNEGHIFIKLTNDSHEDKMMHIKQGQAFAQGIFRVYGLTRNDNVTAKRDGGFGSTNA